MSTYLPGHLFDDDCVCKDCGFDGAEWRWLLSQQHPDDLTSPARQQPPCSANTRERNVFEFNDDDGAPYMHTNEDDWRDE